MIVHQIILNVVICACAVLKIPLESADAHYSDPHGCLKFTSRYNIFTVKNPGFQIYKLTYIPEKVKNKITK